MPVFRSFSYCIIYQANLHPTVGLQTPGEVVEANFGQNTFVFDIEDYIEVSETEKPTMLGKE